VVNSGQAISGPSNTGNGLEAENRYLESAEPSRAPGDPTPELGHVQ